MNLDDFLAVSSQRLEGRQCFICGADSGDDLILPEGWSYLTFTKTGDLAGFYCPKCAADMGLPEARNYHRESN